MQPSIHQPHDKLFKASLKHKEVMYDFLQKRLPADLLKRVDLSTLALENSTFIDPALQETRSDMIYSLAIDGKPGYIYTLVEAYYNTKGKGQELIIPKLNVYNAQLGYQHIEQGRGSKLPAIINLVVYIGKTPYKGPTCLVEAQEHPKLSATLAHQPCILDIAHEPEGKLMQDGKAALMEMLLRQSLMRDFCNYLDDVRVLQLLNQSPYTIESTVYMLAIEPHDPKRITQAMSKLDPDKQKGIMSALQQIRQEGRQEGIMSLVQRGIISKSQAEEVLKG